MRTAKSDESAKPVDENSEKPKQTLFYNQDIRPILAENCFNCHGPDSHIRKADLRMDKHEAAVRIIRSFMPDERFFIARISSVDKDEIMPPVESHKKLTAKMRRETIRKWIAEGAEYEPHWSFIAPTRPAVLKVKNEKWVRQSDRQFHS